MGGLGKAGRAPSLQFNNESRKRARGRRELVQDSDFIEAARGI